MASWARGLLPVSEHQEHGRVFSDIKGLCGTKRAKWYHILREHPLLNILAASLQAYARSWERLRE
jgi:hypothetical protein